MEEEDVPDPPSPTASPVMGWLNDRGFETVALYAYICIQDDFRALRLSEIDLLEDPSKQRLD
ncbi:hypothetical protein CDV55_100354, partial [Aspergillus turcosus]